MIGFFKTKVKTSSLALSAHLDPIDFSLVLKGFFTYFLQPRAMACSTMLS